MASYVQQNEPFEFLDKRRGRGVNTSVLATPANYGSVALAEARLVAFNAAYYTTARLNQMPYNDLMYALRQADDAAGIR